MSKLVVVLSDLHVGAVNSLMPRGYHTKDGNEIGLNPVQEWIHECWDDCWDWFHELRGKEKFDIVLNGDLIDGFHHGTKEIWNHDESEHGLAAYHVLKDVCKPANAVYIVEGTESHSKNFEHVIAKMLKDKGIKIVMPNELKGAWDRLDISFNDTYCRFDHHISTTSRSYLEASALSITYGNLRNEMSRAGHPVPKVVARAHRHRFGHFDDGHGMIFVSPPWQTLTRWAKKVVTEAVPQVGMVVLDWRNTPKDSVPTLHKRLHTIASPEIL